MREQDEDRIIELILRMLEQSNERAKTIKDNAHHVPQYDIDTIKLQQKEFEMQMKLLDKIIKNFKSGEGFIDITPGSKKSIR